jgi:hypothetical protein
MAIPLANATQMCSGPARRRREEWEFPRRRRTAGFPINPVKLYIPCHAPSNRRCAKTTRLGENRLWNVCAIVSRVSTGLGGSDEGTFIHEMAGRTGVLPYRNRAPQKGIHMIGIGIVLMLIGFLLTIPILWSVGIVVLVVGLVLLLLGSIGHEVGGRRHYY